MKAREKVVSSNGTDLTTAQRAIFGRILAVIEELETDCGNEHGKRRTLYDFFSQKKMGGPF